MSDQAVAVGGGVVNTFLAVAATVITVAKQSPEGKVA